MSAVLYNEKEFVRQVAQLLNEGCVGVIPADTIYGISSRADSSGAARIYEVKRRPASKNLIMLASLDWIERSGFEVPEVLYDIWPAPLTAILRAPDGSTQAIRVPADDFIQSLTAVCGPIWSTSCNISGMPSLTRAEDIRKTFGISLDFIVEKRREDAGGLPSTLVDFTSGGCRILRQGAYDASHLIRLASM